MSTHADRRWPPLPAPDGRDAARAGVAALILALAISGSVVAHAELQSSDPENGAVLATPPVAITLTFTEALDASKSSFKVTGPAGLVGTGTVAGDPSRMTLAGLVLTPGVYQIQWTSAAPDGHLERGVLTFTVSEPTPAPPTPAAPTPAKPTQATGATGGASTGPSVAPTPGPTPAPTPRPSAAPAAPVASTTDVLLPIVVAIALVAIVGMSLLRRSRRS